MNSAPPAALAASRRAGGREGAARQDDAAIGIGHMSPLPLKDASKARH
jgi:hypothetical protein